MKTRNIFRGSLILAGLLLLISACNNKDNTPKLDFEITVPNTWSYYALNIENIVYYASSPLENQNDSISEDVLVTKDAIAGMNLAEFTEAEITSLSKDTSYHAIYLSNDTTINGATSRKLIHLQNLVLVRSVTHDSIYLPAKKTSYFFVKNNYGYAVTMNALVTSYATYKPIFDTIISSFKFRN
jgi:hypothetical protein